MKQRSNTAPLFTGTFNAEYSFQMGGLDSYIRGQLTYFGDSQNDPSNPLDDVDAYNLINLYAGISSEDGRWNAMLYVKNIADVDEVTERPATPSSFSVDGVSTVSTYRGVALTDPREIGVNLRYNF